MLCEKAPSNQKRLDLNKALEFQPIMIGGFASF